MNDTRCIDLSRPTSQPSYRTSDIQAQL
ncbi:MAG: hypothetical protein ACJA1W_002778, partial [Akkermansiaceae bacterium]